jgi:hypothetical protein
MYVKMHKKAYLTFSLSSFVLILICVNYFLVSQLVTDIRIMILDFHSDDEIGCMLVIVFAHCVDK